MFDEGKFPYISAHSKSNPMQLDLAEFPTFDECFAITSDNNSKGQSKMQSTTQPSILHTNTCCDANNGGTLNNHDRPAPSFGNGALSNMEELQETKTSLTIEPKDVQADETNSINDVNIINNPSEVYTHPQRNRQPPKHLQDYQCYLTQDTSLVEPRNHHHALKDSRWVVSMKDALHSKKTWLLVPCPQDVNVIGPKWGFRIKHHEDVSVDRFKAHLVA